MKLVFFWPEGRQGHFYRSRNQAFSLVEVVLSLGIATFALVAIAALLPVGVQSSNDSLEESGALNVLSDVVAVRKATPLTSATSTYPSPALTPAMAPFTTNFGIVNDSQFTTHFTQARYRVTCTYTPPAAGTLNPYLGYFKVSWPAAGTNVVGSVETTATFPQP